MTANTKARPASAVFWTNLQVVGKLRRLDRQQCTANTMAYEFSSADGVLRLVRKQRQWIVDFNGDQAGPWRSPDAAVQALARHRSGLAEWDEGKSVVPDDLLDWRPLGESL
jgi:hypothetical protein